MAFYIFAKNADNVYGTLYRIAENQLELDNLITNQHCYKIIEHDSLQDFIDVQNNIKFPCKYNDNIISFETPSHSWLNSESLKKYIDNLKMLIQASLKGNPNSPYHSVWSNYYNQLNSFKPDTLTYPLNKSLEKYFNDAGQLSLNILQLP